MSNYISAVLSAEDQKKVMDLFAEIRKILNYNLTLTNNQKKSMPMLDDGRRPFTEKCLNYGTSEPRIVPPFTDLKELKTDLTLYDMIGPVEMEAESVAQLISDIRMAAGSDAYVAALAIYNSAKNAVKSGVSGVKPIVDELGKMFEANGRTSAKTEKQTV